MTLDNVRTRSELIRRC